MKQVFRAVFAATAAAVIAWPLHAARAEMVSDFTKLDIEEGCRWDSLDHLSESEKEEMLGNSAVCNGLPGFPVHFSEFDLRQFTAFGDVTEEWRTPGGFGQLNRTGDTIEWRLDDGRPHATILRWFIENPNPETGIPDKASEGQVLVISTVARPDGGAPGTSCPAAYVDARANANANELARELADSVARGFTCGRDMPRFHGERGPYSGDPNELAQ